VGEEGKEDEDNEEEAEFEKMEKEAQELAGERLKGHESDRIGTKETISELKKKLLEKAAHTGHRGDLATLIRQGEDVNARLVEDKCYPIHIAVSHNDERMVRMLLAMGARVNVMCRRGMTPLMFAARGPIGDFQHRDNPTTQTEIAVLILSQPNPLVNRVSSEGFSAVTFSVSYGSRDILKLLLDRGAPLKDSDVKRAIEELKKHADHVSLNSAVHRTHRVRKTVVQMERVVDCIVFADCVMFQNRTNHLPRNVATDFCSQVLFTPRKAGGFRKSMGLGPDKP